MSTEPSAHEQQPLLETPAEESSQPTNEHHTAPEETSATEPSVQMKESVTHYNSISVNRHFAGQTKPIGGTAQIIEQDVGGENDFWSIELTFHWRPRNASSEIDPQSSAIQISIDRFLALRVHKDASPANVKIYEHGGGVLADLTFPNGPDAAVAFFENVKRHVDILPIEDEDRPGQLYFIEKRSRMRRAAPSLMNLAADGELDDDFSSLLQDLNISSAAATQDSRRREQTRPRRDEPEQNVGMMILSQFARVTQVAREIGDDISLLLDEKKRSTVEARKHRERVARRRALDIYADIVASTEIENELPPRLTLDDKQGLPVTMQVWNDSFNEAGELKDPVVMKRAIFTGGLAPDARRYAWPFLLNFFAWESNKQERDELVERTNATYDGLKANWQRLQAAAKKEDQESLEKDPAGHTKDRRKRVSEPHAVYLEIEEQIGKDIIRTDRETDLFREDDSPAIQMMGSLLNVYAIYDNRITYCQGMSDFLSPIIYVLGVDEEALAFWCFQSLMRRIEANFRIDQTGINAQLGKLKKLVSVANTKLANFFHDSDPDYYCCFRWVLVRFKRELPFAATARLWEALWARQVEGDDLHIYVAGAMLLAHRRNLLSLQRGAFDCLLRYVNDMSMRIDVDFAIREGELCHRQYSKIMR